MSRSAAERAGVVEEYQAVLRRRLAVPEVVVVGAGAVERNQGERNHAYLRRME